MKSESPLPLKPYLISRHKKPITVKGFATNAIGLIGMTYSAYALWNRKLKPLTARAIGAASAFVSAAPWVFSSSSKTLTVLKKDVKGKNLFESEEDSQIEDLLLEALKANPDTEELDLSELNSPISAQTLIDYLSRTQRLQRIRGQLMCDFPSPTSKRFSKDYKHLYAKLTDFPERLTNVMDIQKLKSYLDFMPNLSVVDIGSIRSLDGPENSIAVLKHLYNRQVPPAFFFCNNLHKVLKAFPEELKKGSPEAKFLASLVRLPQKIEEDAEALQRILLFCKNLRTLQLRVKLSLDIATSIGRLDPKKLSVALQDKDNDKIADSLNKGKPLPKEYEIVLRYETKLNKEISNSKAAIDLLRNYPNIFFGLKGNFKDEELTSLTDALKSFPFHKMRWQQINEIVTPTIALRLVKNDSCMLRLAIACIPVLPWDIVTDSAFLKNNLNKLGETDAISFYGKDIEELELLKSKGSQKMFIIESGGINIDQLIPCNPSAFFFALYANVTQETLSKLKEQKYKAYISTVLEDRFMKKHLNLQPLDQFFEQGSLVEFPSYPPFRTLSKQAWDQQCQKKPIHFNLTYSYNKARSYTVYHHIYFARLDAILPQKVFEYRLRDL